MDDCFGSGFEKAYWPVLVLEDHLGKENQIKIKCLSKHKKELLYRAGYAVVIGI